MMAEPIIHIGLHKTATTFLQERVFPQLSEINLVTRPYTQHNHAFNQMQYADESLYSAAMVSKELDKILSGGGRLLLSDEAFSGKAITFNYINRSIVASRLKELLPQSTIILFIRGQAEIIYSHFNQYIGLGGTKRIDKFLWRSNKDFAWENNGKMIAQRFGMLGKSDLMSTLKYNTNSKLIHIDNFRYLELVELYKNLFENVMIFTYEDLVTNPREIGLRLSEIFGQPVDVTAGAGKRVNTSINSFYINAVRIANYFESPFGTSCIGSAARYLPNWAPFRNGHNRCRNKIREMIGSYYVENNRKLVEKYPEIGIQKYPDKYLLE